MPRKAGARPSSRRTFSPSGLWMDLFNLPQAIRWTWPRCCITGCEVLFKNEFDPVALVTKKGTREPVVGAVCSGHTSAIQDWFTASNLSDEPPF